jgi:hypothetical protein
LGGRKLRYPLTIQYVAEIHMSRLGPLRGRTQWFIGFVLPAFGAYWVTRTTEWRAQIRKEQDALAVYRTLHKTTVDAAIVEIVNVLKSLSDYIHPGEQFLQTFRNNQMLENLPSWTRERIIRWCETDKIGPIARDMIRLFPLNAQELRDAANKAGFRTWGPF